MLSFLHICGHWTWVSILFIGFILCLEICLHIFGTYCSSISISIRHGVVCVRALPRICGKFREVEKFSSVLHNVCVCCVVFCVYGCFCLVLVAWLARSLARLIICVVHCCLLFASHRCRHCCFKRLQSKTFRPKIPIDNETVNSENGIRCGFVTFRRLDAPSSRLLATTNVRCLRVFVHSSWKKVVVVVFF